MRAAVGKRQVVTSKNQGERQFFLFVFNSWENLQKSQGYSERNCKFLYSNNESHGKSSQNSELDMNFMVYLMEKRCFSRSCIIFS